MKKKFEKQNKIPLAVIHGGAWSGDSPNEVEKRQKAIRWILDRGWKHISKGQGASEAVTNLVGMLEADPLFNAGKGATLQADGMARLSASLMEGKSQQFSGVHLVTHTVHPSKLAAALQQKQNRVLGPVGSQLLARELGIPPENPVTPEEANRWASWIEKTNSPTHSTSQPHALQGTVGAVVIDAQGNLAAATSTGGVSFVTPERISDSATPAGNYATSYAAISCTGTGEHIFNHGAAVRLETRVCDGKTIIEASELLLKEIESAHSSFGWVAVDRMGNIAMCTSTEGMVCLAMAASFSEPVSL